MKVKQQISASHLSQGIYEGSTDLLKHCGWFLYITEDLLWSSLNQFLCEDGAHIFSLRKCILFPAVLASKMKFLTHFRILWSLNRFPKLCNHLAMPHYVIKIYIFTFDLSGTQVKIWDLLQRFVPVNMNSLDPTPIFVLWNIFHIQDNYYWGFCSS